MKLPIGLTLLVVLLPSFAGARPWAGLARQSVPTLTSHYTTHPPRIDGEMTAGEWDEAKTESFAFDMYSTADGQATRSIPGDLSFLHDAENLYLAIRLYQIPYHNRYQDPAEFDALVLLFDNNNNGTIERLEDRKFVFSLQTSEGSGQRGYFSDEHYTPVEGEPGADLHIDGVARIVHSHPSGIGDYTIEMAVPLDSGYPDDVSLGPGQRVKFNLLFATAAAGQFDIGAFFTLTDTDARDWGYLQLDGGALPGPDRPLPNGRIAFITPEIDGRDEVYVINADGTGLKRLTNNPQAKNWVSLSRDRKKVVYVEAQADKPDSGEIWSIDIDSNFFPQRRLTFNNMTETRPSYSPDGSRIAFSRAGEVWTMRADGSDQRQVTSDPAEDSEPDWGPDGRIVFKTGRFSDHDQLAIMNADGSSLTRLTRSAGADQSPSFSPDGKNVTFQRYEGPGPYYDFLTSFYNSWNVYVVGANGTEARALTGDGLVNWRPVTAPDNRTVLYQKTTDLFTFCTRIYGTAVSDGGELQVLKLLSRVRYFDYK